jgi:hypothetical protein
VREELEALRRLVRELHLDAEALARRLEAELAPLDARGLRRAAAPWRWN